MIKNAIILMGLPLSGKSTWIKNNVSEDYCKISADTLKENHEDYDPNNTEPLHEWSVTKAESILNEVSETGVDIVFDSGSINNSYTTRIIETLKTKGYKIELVHIRTPYTICLERNKKRSRKIPELAIIQKAIKENKQFHRLKSIVDEVSVVNYFTNKHLFIDMDGVIASLSTLPTIDGRIDFVNAEVHKHLEPVTPIIDKLNSLKELGYNLYILSAIPNSFSLTEKQAWLDEHFNIEPKYRFFVNQGRHKAEMLDNLSTYLKIDKKDICMVDDIHSILYDVKEMNMNCMHVSEFLIHKF